MPEVGYLQEVMIVLLAAIVFALVFRSIRLGSMIGYLAAGAVIGPTGLGLVTGGETISALAELGVVFLLFTVGLELPLERIRVTFGPIFILGAAQVMVTATAIAGVAFAFGLSPEAAVVIGGGLALSSTAIVLRLLSERAGMTSRLGRSAFGILLVQDIAVGPFLVVVIALGQDTGVLASLGFSLLKALVAVLALLGIGRIILRHVFWPVAALWEPEIFTAMTLLVVLASAVATKLAGLSMGFGAFLAGMLLAETHYRHQVSAVIQPFRGLLLGLFFIAIGLSLDLAPVLERAWLVFLILVSLLLGKAIILTGLARLSGIPLSAAVNLGILLSQGGEFAFVLFAAALGLGLLPTDIGQILIVAVGLSMVATPILAGLGDSAERRMERAGLGGVEDIEHDTEAIAGHVIIAGYGRVGAAVADGLAKEGVPFVAVDVDPRRIVIARQRGQPVFYGDATQPEILQALHVERARCLVVAMNDPRAALQAVSLVTYIFPDLPVFARARDEHHAEELKRRGAEIVVPELAPTGARIAESILHGGSLPADSRPGGGS